MICWISQIRMLVVASFCIPVDPAGTACRFASTADASADGVVDVVEAKPAFERRAERSAVGSVED
jgi:hypothetical protein